MLQVKPIRTILLALSYVCLFVFLAEKTAVPLLHHHHEVPRKVQGDNLQNATDCFACDLAKATLDAEHALVLSVVFVLSCLGVLQLFRVMQQTFPAAIFTSLRAPPLLAA